jgi:hypothetical protein
MRPIICHMARPVGVSVNAGFLRFERVKRWAEDQILQGDLARYAETILSVRLKPAKSAAWL